MPLTLGAYLVDDSGTGFSHRLRVIEGGYPWLGSPSLGHYRFALPHSMGECPESQGIGGTGDVLHHPHNAATIDGR